MLTVPKIYIIIVNWNSWEDTSECLDSVTKIVYPSYDVIVVDNGSTDGSKALIRRRYPGIILLEHERNLGLAAANNTGLRYALNHQADYCLILNNDTIVDPSILKEFLLAAQQHPEGGIWGARIYYYSNPQRIWWAQSRWNQKDFCFEHEGSGEGEAENIGSQSTEIDYANGCALFVRREVPHRIGFMDERFFIYYEDIDWCSRAQRVGYKILSVPTARIWHKEARSCGGPESPVVPYFKVRNQLLWARKNLNRRGSRFWLRKITKFLVLVFPRTFSGAKASRAPIERFSSCEKKGSFFVRFYRDLASFLQPTHKAMMRGLFDYVLGRFGDCPDSIRKMAQGRP